MILTVCTRQVTSAGAGLRKHSAVCAACTRVMICDAIGIWQWDDVAVSGHDAARSRGGLRAVDCKPMLLPGW